MLDPELVEHPWWVYLTAFAFACYGVWTVRYLFFTERYDDLELPPK